MSLKSALVLLSQLFLVTFLTLSYNVEKVKGQTGSYLNATLLPESHQKFAIQEVHLYPGWTFPLKHSIEQTLVPEVGSTLKRTLVRVIPGFQRVDTEDEDFHAHVYFDGAVEPVTIYIDLSKPEIGEPTPTPEYVDENSYLNGSLSPYPWHLLARYGEKFRIYPAWTGILQHNITRTFVPFESGTRLTTHKVVVVPTHLLILTGDPQMHASVYHPDSKEYDYVTIFPAKDEPAQPVVTTTAKTTEKPTEKTTEKPTTTVKSTPGPNTFVTAKLVPEKWHEFGAEEVHLMPEWTEVLTQNLTRLLKPEPGSRLLEQYVTVAPGWRVLAQNDGGVHAKVHLINDIVDNVTIYPQ